MRKVPFLSLCSGLFITLTLGACASLPVQPEIQQADAVRQVMAHYRGPVSVESASVVTPAEFVALSSEQASDFVPTRNHDEDKAAAEASSWFLEPGILNEECPHCQARGGVITSHYGNRNDPLRPNRVRKHNGVDLRVPLGSAALAFKGGTVTRASRFSSYGLTVEIMQYDGYLARYAHLNKIMVEEGQEVDAGIQIGEVGRTGRVTGPHLHFELIKDGKSINPMTMVTRVEQVVRCNQLEASKEKQARDAAKN